MTSYTPKRDGAPREKRTLSPAARRRLETQGFLGLPDDLLAGIGLGLRFSPAVYLLWAGTGVAFRSPEVLMAMVPLLVAGGLARSFPLDVIYDRWIRPRLGTPSLPPYPAPRRFASWVGAFWITGTAILFAAGLPIPGTMAGGIYLGAALANILSGWCFGSTIHRRIFGPTRRYRLDG
jgi:hypothetical protein